ncbi:MAG: low temperature requirement protein A [Geodermatophilaceae bacterium]|nr:low temperature requirement protein A [Geodermatophilaceae bacterium]
MTTSRTRRARLQQVGEHANVTPLELFFDLVFVFALTQITALMADDPSARGLVRGLLILAVPLRTRRRDRRAAPAGARHDAGGAARARTGCGD